MLRRTLGTGDFTALVIGGTMGLGPLFMPAIVLQYSDVAPGRALLAYLLVGLAALAGALTFAELGAMHPGRGGMYAHIRDAFGDFPAFVFGWTLFFVLASGEIALIARASAGYLREVFEFPEEQAGLVAAGMIAASALVSARSTRAAISVARLATAVVGAAVLVIGVALVARGAGAGIDLTAPPVAAPLTTPGWMFTTLMWSSYMGWQYALMMAGETRDPDRSFPVGLVVGISMLIVAYLLMTVALSTLSRPNEAAAAELGGAAFRAVLGPVGGGVASGVYALALFTLAHVILLASARVTAAMAEDGLFFRGLAVFHPRAGTPSRALWAGAVVAGAGTAVGVPDRVSEYTALLGWMFVGVAALSIFVFRRRFPDAERPFRVPAYPWTPLVFLGTVAAMVFTLTRNSPNTVVGAFVVLFAVAAVYRLWYRRRPPRSGESLAELTIEGLSAGSVGGQAPFGRTFNG